MLVFYSVRVIIASGLAVFCSSREHLLSTLLRLEFMVLGVFFLLLRALRSGILFYSLIYLVITACEGALGLSILVAIRRVYGGDYFKSLNFILH